MNRNRKGICRSIVVCLLFCLFTGLLSGCSSDGIKEETMKAVKEKKSQVLALYSDVEKLVEEHSMEVDESFRKMKQQLLDMSEKVEKKVEETTEADGQRALQELKRLEDNLQAAKENVESHIVQ